jgi:hypothetical protein
MRKILVSATVLAVFSLPALADRPVTDAERVRLVAAVTAAGCTGGQMEWDEDDKEFDVNDAMCEGRKYDLKFNAEYALKSKKLDD